MKSISEKFTIVFISGVLLCVIASVFFSFWKSTNTETYRLVRNNEGIVADLGTVASSVDDITIVVPLDLLDLMPGSIKTTIPTCTCTVGDIKDQDREIKIAFNPKGKSGHVEQGLAVIPKSSHLQTRIIKIRANVIPAWVWQPAKIELRNLLPGQSQPFQCEISIQYPVETTKLLSYKASSSLPNLDIKAVVIDPVHIRITGEGVGGNVRGTYKGYIEVCFEAETEHELHIPVEISNTGIIQAFPETVVLDSTAGSKAIISFQHYCGENIVIGKIENPEYLKVTKIENDAKSSVQVDLLISKIMKDDSKSPRNIILKVFFKNYDDPVEIPIIVL